MPRASGAWRAAWLLWWGVGWAVAAGAVPTVTARVDRASVTLGDRIGVQLELRYGKEQEPLPPDVQGWLQGLEPGAVSRVDSVEADTRIRLFRTTIQVFQLGETRIPSLEVRFVEASGDTLVRRTEEQVVEVRSVRQADDRDPRDIKPPVPVGGGVPLWAVIVAVVLLLLAAGMLLYHWRRTRGHGAAPVQPPPPVDYAAEFRRIAGMGLLERGEYKAYYTLLADNLRRFLEQALAIEAMERTTDEIGEALRDRQVESELREAIRVYLMEADLVKFARRIPHREEARQAPERGLELLRSIQRRWTSGQRVAEAKASGHQMPDGSTESCSAVESGASSSGPGGGREPASASDES